VRSITGRKVGVYAEHVARGTAAGLWDPTVGVEPVTRHALEPRRIVLPGSGVWRSVLHMGSL